MFVRAVAGGEEKAGESNNVLQRERGGWRGRGRGGNCPLQRRGRGERVGGEVRTLFLGA